MSDTGYALKNAGERIVIKREKKPAIFVKEDEDGNLVVEVGGNLYVLENPGESFDDFLPGAGSSGNEEDTEDSGDLESLLDDIDIEDIDDSDISGEAPGRNVSPLLSGYTAEEKASSAQLENLVAYVCDLEQRVRGNEREHSKSGMDIKNVKWIFGIIAGMFAAVLATTANLMISQLSDIRSDIRDLYKIRAAVVNTGPSQLPMLPSVPQAKKSGDSLSAQQ